MRTSLHKEKKKRKKPVGSIESAKNKKPAEEAEPSRAVVGVSTHTSSCRHFLNFDGA